MIHIKNIYKSFWRNLVLDNINFSLWTGETVSLIWPSWSGKTTLIRCIASLETIDSWSIDLWERVWVVFQDFNLRPHMTVLENIMMPLLLQKKLSKHEAWTKAMHRLAKVQLSEKADSYPNNLSGWQKQRVAIARSMAFGTKILLLDEITSSLDPELIFWILKLIKILSHEWITMLIVTHHMSFAKEISDRILFIDHGSILEESKPDHFFASSENTKIKQFLAS